MESVNFLSLDYILLAFYKALTGFDSSVLPSVLQNITGVIETVGIFGSLFLLSMLVYSHMRVEQIQIDVKHHRHDMEDEAIGHVEVKNARWEEVMTLMTSGSVSDWRAAILEADIILDELLTQVGLPGDTVADKLKGASRGTFNTLDLAWEAHKIRNEVAHSGSTYELTQREASRTIDLFRQVFEEFDYI